jgi:hypothetical protein
VACPGDPVAGAIQGAIEAATFLLGEMAVLGVSPNHAVDTVLLLVQPAGLLPGQVTITQPRANAVPLAVLAPFDSLGEALRVQAMVSMVAAIQVVEARRVPLAMPIPWFTMGGGGRALADHQQQAGQANAECSEVPSVK